MNQSVLPVFYHGIGKISMIDRRSCQDSHMNMIRMLRPENREHTGFIDESLHVLLQFVAQILFQQIETWVL